MKTFILGSLTLLIFALAPLRAEIAVYKSTDDTGLNKKERIDTVESYLATLSASLKKMEEKLDENAKKIIALDQNIKGVQEKLAKSEAEQKLARLSKADKQKKGESDLEQTAEGKDKEKDKGSDKAEEKMDARVGERTEKSEIERLKSEMAAKNKDLEKFKVQLEELSDTVKAIQATLKRE